MIFYLIDLGLYTPDEFAAGCVEVEGESLLDAAKEWARCAFDEYCDGQTVDARIAPTRDGKDAVNVTITQRVEVTYTAEVKRPAKEHLHRELEQNSERIDALQRRNGWLAAELRARAEETAAAGDWLADGRPIVAVKFTVSIPTDDETEDDETEENDQ